MSALLDADQAQSSTLAADRVEVEAAAIVSDRQLDQVAPLGDRHPEPARASVCDAVSECFLHDSKQAQRHIAMDMFDVPLRAETDFNVVVLGDFHAVRPQ